MKSLVLSCGLILALLLGTTAQDHNGRCKRDTRQGTDCTQIHSQNTSAPSGVYSIQPFGTQETFQVYCEMRTDGGWMVLQRRSGEDLSFRRQWREYKDGFGDLMSDHWLGLSKVYSVTQEKMWILRVDLAAHDNDTAFALYTNFSIGNEESAFKLQVGEYSGNAGDAFHGAYSDIDQNGYGFSTSDRDNDGCSPCIFGDIVQYKCASSEDGWWYSRCGSASLNGDWHSYGNHIGWSSGLYWKTWKNEKGPYSFKESTMMIKSA